MIEIFLNGSAPGEHADQRVPRFVVRRALPTAGLQHDLPLRLRRTRLSASVMSASVTAP
jgi:hypothetical protein